MLLQEGNPQHSNYKVDKLLFTCTEVADLTALSLGLIRKLIREGQLDSIKVGRCVRISRSALLRLCGVQSEEAR